MPTTTSPKFVSDLDGAAVISHSPVVMPIVPGGQLINMGSIMVENDPAGIPPDRRLRIIHEAAEIPNIFGILIETIDAGAAGSTEEVNAAVDRKGAFRVDQLEVGSNASVAPIDCVERFRELGIFLEGLGVPRPVAPNP